MASCVHQPMTMSVPRAQTAQIRTGAELRISLSQVQAVQWRVFAAVLCLNCLALVLSHGFGYYDRNAEGGGDVAGGQITQLAKGVIPLVHLDYERNLPTLFSVILMLQASFLSMTIATRRVRRRVAWGFLAVIFSALALDEFASIHEELITPVRSLLGSSGFFYFAWIIPYGVVVALMAVGLFRWFFELPTSTRRRLGIAAAVYLVGTLVLEGVGGWHYQSVGDRFDVTFDLFVTAEESLEMIGLILFGRAAAEYLTHDVGLQRVRLAR